MPSIETGLQLAGSVCVVWVLVNVWFLITDPTYITALKFRQLDLGGSISALMLVVGAFVLGHGIQAVLFAWCQMLG